MRRTLFGALLGCASCLVLLGLGCGEPVGTEGEGAGPREALEDRKEVIQAHRAFISAYESGDAAAIAAMLSTDPQPLVFHPLTEGRFDGADAISEALPRMFEKLGGVEWTDIHPAIDVEGDVAWLSFHVIAQSANMGEPFVGRGSEVWVRRDDGWKLAHAHLSQNPELEQEAATPPR